MISLHWTIAIALALDVVTYLAVLRQFLNHLRRLHAATWAELGRPYLSMGREVADNPQKVFRTGFLTFKFIFSSQYKRLDDARLRTMIWLIRGLLALAIPLMIVTATEGIR